MVNLLSNMINKINMAHKAKSAFVTVRVSTMLLDVLKILHHNGVILAYKILSLDGSDVDVTSVIIYLKYYNGKPLISSLEMVSKPSLRVYYSFGQLTSNMYKSKLQGFFVMSTNQGIIASVDLLSFNKNSPLNSGEILLRVLF